MNVRWVTIPDPLSYVTKVLSYEAPDITLDAITRFPWQTDDLRLDKLRVDAAMLARHDREPLHVKRRDLFVTSIVAGRAIAPFIALGGDLFLVDGYARYRALKQLDVDHGHILRQVVEGQGLRQCAAGVASSSAYNRSPAMPSIKTNTFARRTTHPRLSSTTQSVSVS